MPIGNVDVARFQAIWRQAARINPGAAVVELVAAAMRQWDRDVSIADARQRVRQIGQMLCWATRWTTSPSRWMRPWTAIILAARITRRCLS
jgi:hypothetical protein